MGNFHVISRAVGPRMTSMVADEANRRRKLARTSDFNIYDNLLEYAADMEATVLFL